MTCDDSFSENTDSYNLVPRVFCHIGTEQIYPNFCLRPNMAKGPGDEVGIGIVKH